MLKTSRAEGAMNPDQFQELLRTVHESSGGTGIFTWLMAALALGSILVSVAGVVIGNRAAVAAMSKQLTEQGVRLETLTNRVSYLAERVAVMEYAMGLPPGQHNQHGMMPQKSATGDV